MRILFFDCFAGVSGDMLVGSLLDLGLEFELLRRELNKLNMEGYSIDVRRENRAGITGCRFEVSVGEGQPERKLDDIRVIIGESSLDEDVKAKSIQVFEKLAQVEAKIHGTTPDRIHFHELGGIDTVVDIVSTVVGLKALGVKEVYSSRIPFSRGTIKMEHGLYPGPPPAVLELLSGVGMYESGRSEELVTPTGATLLVTLSKSFGFFPSMKILRVGYGAGARNPSGFSNVLRAIMGEKEGEEGLESEKLTVVETNIDDMSPEGFDHLTERLLSIEGVYDVSLENVIMKKGRPGVLVSVICLDEKTVEVAKTLLRESTTLGVRYYNVYRYKLKRREEKVSTRYGDIRVKIVDEPGLGIKRAKPEYEDCKDAAARHGVLLSAVYDEVKRALDRD